MNNYSESDFERGIDKEIREQILRYFSFWPWFLTSVVFSLIISFTYLRYVQYEYQATSLIEIFDESQDSEMALPTELTVFNRSMINLENDMNILNSFSLHKKTIVDFDFNISYYITGSIKTSELQKSAWIDDFTLNYKFDTDTIKSEINFEIKFLNSGFIISQFDDNYEEVASHKFMTMNTTEFEHNLPIELTINQVTNLEDRKIRISPADKATKTFMKSFFVSPMGSNSDQLSLKMNHPNKKIASKYLSAVMKYFDEDGIRDRQLEYIRTIDFVDVRSEILKKELDLIEFQKQNFKQTNNLSDLKSDASVNIEQQFSYNSELFNAQSQLILANYLLESISKNKYEFLPVNIGISEINLNEVITEFNNFITQRNKYLIEAGPNNFLLKTVENQLDNLSNNIKESINNFVMSQEIKINMLTEKEKEFELKYDDVPQNEKILRSINRELNIKEALFLLLLQKKEEASINLAVVKPTIKVIDAPIINDIPINPNPQLVYLSSIFIAVFTPFSILFLLFYFDNKIHTKEHLLKLLNPEIPIIGEIPFVNKINPVIGELATASRTPIYESIRMLLSNLRFSNNNLISQKKSQTIIFTSSIKGEGKTLASVHSSMALANDLKKEKKVILLGTDLRNPQIHKNFNVDRDQNGISEIIYNNDFKNYSKYIKKFENLDVLFSGAIPPNPTALLSSDVFRKLISELKNEYDYIIIDSAPCLLVSDTFQFIDLADSVVYLFRANFTDSKITDFINDVYINKKVKNLNIVLNAVGNSKTYGYKYGYQYGYQYGYKYSYNYGYGYGYSNDKE